MGSSGRDLCARSQFIREKVSGDGNLTKLAAIRTGIRFWLLLFWVNRLFKTFVFGIILGLFGTGALAYFAPVIDIHRERSLIEVQPNGGNVEEFRINLPRDRIMAGLAGSEESLPAGLDWPGADLLGDTQAEIFKVRNRDNTVIGVASRLANSADSTGPFIEWALHFPARGTLYAQMALAPSSEGFRTGVMRAGTRNFLDLSGTMRERFVPREDGESDAHGHIELQALLVAPLGDVE
jgi:hypothetical protein